MRLFIAEKPSVAKVIIEALGMRKREQRYFEAKTGDVVTWCFGHLLELAPPDTYLSDDVPLNKNGKNKEWRLEDLPILPKEWIKVPKDDTKAQLNFIGKLLKSCSSVVNCGDPDREGQLLIDEILEYFHCTKPVERYWANAQDKVSVQRALSSLLPNASFSGMALAATGRQRADWLIGMNLTRAYTLRARNTLKQAPLLSVGRVQTPTLNLVAQRDLEIKQFKPTSFYKIQANVEYQGQSFIATLDPLSLNSGLDKGYHLADPALATKILSAVKSVSQGAITAVENKIIEKAQPLSLSLADVQMYASSKLGFSAQKTLNICQKLYETYKLTTYPRSDCSYLPEVQHQDAPLVLASLAQVNPDLSELIAGANPQIKSDTWNSKKITAHHGIIPTQQVIDRHKLSPDEQAIYLFIVKRYLAQFYPKCQLSSCKITLDLGGYIFKATGSSILVAGFKRVFADDDDDDDDDVPFVTQNTKAGRGGASASKGSAAQASQNVAKQKLPACKQGELVAILDVKSITDHTKPPASYNEGTLIRAMENIATVVSNPTYRQLLKEGDGIGTSATRAAIIEELKRKKYLELKGKKLKCTKLGFSLLKNLPDLVKNPVLTAIFESKLKDIEAKKMQLATFENDQLQKFVINQTLKAKAITIVV